MEAAKAKAKSSRVMAAASETKRTLDAIGNSRSSPGLARLVQTALAAESRPRMDRRRISQYVGRTWDEQIVPKLVDYIRIPNKSPQFDPDWEKNGHMARAVELIAGWCKTQTSAIPGLKVDVIKDEGRTPLI